MTDATEPAKIIDALALQYNTTSVKDAGAEVSVTLYQEFSVTMTLETDLSEPQLCTVLTLALTLDSFSPNCAATTGVGGVGSTDFLLTYPLEGDLVAVNAKTAQMRAFITDADVASAMVAATASLRRQRRRGLALLSVSGVQPPVTQLGAKVTIVVQQLAAEE